MLELQDNYKLNKYTDAWVLFIFNYELVYIFSTFIV